MMTFSEYEKFKRIIQNTAEHCIEKDLFQKQLGVQNNALVLENTRLMFALDLLKENLHQHADEALNQAFSMSGDIFATCYPKSGQKNCIICYPFYRCVAFS